MTEDSTETNRRKSDSSQSDKTTKMPEEDKTEKENQDEDEDVDDDVEDIKSGETDVAAGGGKGADTAACGRDDKKTGPDKQTTVKWDEVRDSTPDVIKITINIVL